MQSPPTSTSRVPVPAPVPEPVPVPAPVPPLAPVPRCRCRAGAGGGAGTAKYLVRYRGPYRVYMYGEATSSPLREYWLDTLVVHATSTCTCIFSSDTDSPPSSELGRAPARRFSLGSLSCGVHVQCTAVHPIGRVTPNTVSRHYWLDRPLRGRKTDTRGTRPASTPRTAHMTRRVDSTRPDATRDALRSHDISDTSVP
jgi:hypothetical protein